MKTRSSFRRVVVITAIAAAGCLGIAAIIGLATTGFIPGRFGGQGITVDESKRLPSAGVALVVVDSVSDNVRIAEGTEDAIVARLHGTAGSASADTVPHLFAESSGSTADIRLERGKAFSLGFTWDRLVLDVSVPKGYRGKLEVHSVSADLDLADHAWQGVALRTTSGSMKAGAVTASEFSAHSTSGNLLVSSLDAARTEISSVSGDVRLESVHGDVSATSVSGDMAVTFVSAAARLDAQSTSGSVSVRLPPDAAFVLDAHSTSGNVTCRFPIVVQDSRNGGGNHVLSGKVGSGTGLVAVRTVSGDIRVSP